MPLAFIAVISLNFENDPNVINVVKSTAGGKI